MVVFASERNQDNSLDILSTITLHYSTTETYNATGELEDSGQANDEKMSRKTVHSLSFLSFCLFIFYLFIPFTLRLQHKNSNIYIDNNQRT